MNKWLTPLVDFGRIRAGLRAYWNYVRDWQTYARMPGAERLSVEHAHPCLYDRTIVTNVDAHYFYQSKVGKTIRTRGMTR